MAGVFSRVHPKVIFGGLIVASVAVMLVAARQPEPPATPVPAEPRAHERPWLSEAAADQLLGPEGTPGPLFAGIDLGGPGPSPEARARIAEFAKANALDIKFEIIANELVAVRFGVTFGGCCGYEGADRFARHFARPMAQEYCTAPHEWIDDWGTTLADGLHVRGRVRVNRVEIRWELAESFDELLTQAEQLVGKDRAAVREATGDRWTELQPNHIYLLEQPYTFDHSDSINLRIAFDKRDDLGFRITTEHGVITEVAFDLRDFERVDGDLDLSDALAARWGRPQMTDTPEGELATWKRHDRTFTAERTSFSSRIVLR